MARPQQFDRKQVIDAAIHLFKTQGYGATSVPDLVKATGLQPGSLYGAFGNKKGILVEALNVYLEDTNNMIRQCFDAADSPLDGLRDFLLAIGSQCSGAQGCLIVTSLLEMDSADSELDTQLQRLIHRFESLFFNQLRKAQQQGEIADSQDCEALAKFFVCNLWGLRVLAKTKPTAESVQMVVDQMMSHLNRCTQTV